MDCYTWLECWRIAHVDYKWRIYGYRYAYWCLRVYAVCVCLFAYQMSNVMDKRSVELSCRVRMMNAHINNMYTTKHRSIWRWLICAHSVLSWNFFFCLVFACSISFAHLIAHARAIQSHRCCYAIQFSRYCRLQRLICALVWIYHVRILFGILKIYR